MVLAYEPRPVDVTTRTCAGTRTTASPRSGMMTPVARASSVWLFGSLAAKRFPRVRPPDQVRTGTPSVVRASTTWSLVAFMAATSWSGFRLGDHVGQSSGLPGQEFFDA
ncbi:hypothetical protein WKI68_25485 [Streptomyces sp. MS1.HAVA.3]|uniref:Uncharacterized protein n=1 Tax=Streptomyces caledonius TaxID=3134107 RepID=A0ABU8U7G3_9ACTN